MSWTYFLKRSKFPSSKLPNYGSHAGNNKSQGNSPSTSYRKTLKTWHYIQQAISKMPKALLSKQAQVHNLWYENVLLFSCKKNIIFTTTKKKRSGIQPRFESEVSWNSGLFRFGTRVSGKSLRLLFSKKKFISSTNDVTKVEGFNIISWIIHAFDWLLPMIYWRTKHRWRHHYQYFALLIVYKTLHFALDLYCNRSQKMSTLGAVSVPLFYSYHILTSSVIYYWTDSRTLLVKETFRKYNISITVTLLTPFSFTVRFMSSSRIRVIFTFWGSSAGNRQNLKRNK